MRQFKRIYEDDETIETWTFDLDIFDKGPIEVDINYKKGAEKQIAKRIKENKEIKSNARKMKKINKRNNK